MDKIKYTLYSEEYNTYEPTFEVYKVGDAKYGRSMVVWVKGNICLVCNLIKECLHIDSSDGEYGPVVICLGCADLFIRVK